MENPLCPAFRAEIKGLEKNIEERSKSLDDLKSKIEDLRSSLQNAESHNNQLMIEQASDRILLDKYQNLLKDLNCADE